MYAVISTMIFFVPMFFLPGTMAQAAYAIPVVVILALGFSLAFGVLFATGVTLVLVPCLYLLGEQVSAHLLHRRQALPDAIDGI